ncbi:MAG: AbrB family transcriptional regulator [Oscillatoriales cyanobacterium SM2_2_1]|nr:AbrB family transcriptional regulator [Oscillatoriales cyanobacterium SM2_2_1]
MTTARPLTGEDLLQKIKELGNLPKDEKAKACGYVTITKNGQDRINLMQFYNALIEADGHGKDKKTSQRGGRSASYRVSVQRNGNLLIGSVYTEQMGLEPGDELEIHIGRKYIQLRPIHQFEEEDD